MKKRLIPMLVIAAMVMTMFTPFAIPGVSAADVSINFDNLTAFVEKTDFITGGAYKAANVSLSSEQDHTTGSGKSLKLVGRTQKSHRVKFINAVTSDMLGKEVTASFWAMTPVDTKLMIGAFSDVNTTFAIEAYAKETVDMKANTWTKLSVTFDNQDPLITQIGVSQDTYDGDVADTIYIDDLFVTASGSSEPATTGPTTPDNPTTPTTEIETPPVSIPGSKTENVLTFDNLTSVEEGNIEGGGGASIVDFSLSSDYYYGGAGEGQSIGFTGRANTYSRIKFMDAFKDLPQEAGTKYNISMMVRIGDTARVEAGQFTIGVITFLGQVTAETGEYYFDENYHYTAKRGEWTKVEMQYVSTGQEVYGVTLDQVAIPDVPHDEYVVSDLYIDDVTVKVSTEDVPKQPVLTDLELRNLANLGIDVLINGNRISFANDVKPTLVDDRTLVPLRKIFENLNVAVYWDEATSTVTAKRGTDEIKLTIGDKTAYVNGEAVELDVPAQLLEDRTVVPIRFVAESLGCVVDWDEQKQQVIITADNVANEIYIYGDSLNQEIYGFGASANHNAWYLMNASEEMQQRTLKALYDVDEGIGLNIVRLEVNPYTPNDKSNFNPEFQYTISPEKDVWDMDADEHQIWYSKAALEIDPTLQFMATPWSPPAWMKENKSVVGKTEVTNTLAKENYDYYAEYLARWTKHYKDDLGFDIKWMSIQNEPTANTVYASCIYGQNDLLDLTKTVVNKFKEEGISTLVGGPEGSSQATSNAYMNQWTQMDEEFVQNDLGVVITHSYGYSDTTLDGTNLERFNLPLIQTEKCTSVDERREFSNATLMRYGNEILDHLNHNYNAWCYWYGIRKTDNLGTQNGESLVDFSDTTKEISFAREYYAMGQFSKFMRPGYYRVTSYSHNPDVAVTTAVNPETGKLVTVVINNGTSDITMAVNGFSGAAASVYRSGEGEDLAKLDDIAIANGTANVSFKAQTITTLVEQ